MTRSYSVGQTQENICLRWEITPQKLTIRLIRLSNKHLFKSYFDHSQQNFPQGHEEEPSTSRGVFSFFFFSPSQSSYSEETWGMKYRTKALLTGSSANASREGEQMLIIKGLWYNNSRSAPWVWGERSFDFPAWWAVVYTLERWGGLARCYIEQTSVCVRVCVCVCVSVCMKVRLISVPLLERGAYAVGGNRCRCLCLHAP